MQTLKRLLLVYVRIVQKGVIAVALFLLYVAGFGVTALLMAAVRPERREKHENGDTFWRKAEGYALTVKECCRES